MPDSTLKHKKGNRHYAIEAGKRFLALAVFLLGASFINAWVEFRTLPPFILSLLSWAASVETANWWNLLDFIVNLVLVFVAVWGLKSLRMTKADIKARHNRDESERAIACAEEFAQEILPLNSSFLMECQQAGVSTFVGEPKEVTFDPDNTSLLGPAQIWINNLGPNGESAGIAVLNRLEAWSMYFICGVARIDVAYRPCAPVLVQMVTMLYPIMLVKRASKTSGRYPNLVQLFVGWNALLAKEAAGLEANDLLKELEALRSRSAGLAAHTEVLPKTIGDALDI